MDTEGIGQKNPETRQVAAKAPMRERGHLFLNVQHGKQADVLAEYIQCFS